MLATEHFEIIGRKIGEVIKRERLAENMTQKDLANAIGLSPSSISMIESGERLPTLQQLIILGEYFFLSYDELLRIGSDKVQHEYIETTGLSKKDKEVLQAMVEVLRSKESRRDLLLKNKRYVFANEES